MGLRSVAIRTPSRARNPYRSIAKCDKVCKLYGRSSRAKQAQNEVLLLIGGFLFSLLQSVLHGHDERLVVKGLLNDADSAFR
jgi:hypothetical protein